MVFAGYGRCMGGECVVFAGWPAYGGRAFAEASRGRCVVFAGYGRCMGGECVVFAGYGHCMGGECVVFPAYTWIGCGFVKALRNIRTLY